MKFKLKKGRGQVHNFTDAKGNVFLPGDIVDLPASYQGEAWLQKVEPESKPVAPPSSVEAPPEVAPETVSKESVSEKKSRKLK